MLKILKRMCNVVKNTSIIIAIIIPGLIVEATAVALVCPTFTLLFMPLEYILFGNVKYTYDILTMLWKIKL